MDPNAVLAALRAAIREFEECADGIAGDPEHEAASEVADKAASLIEWLDKGGFLPRDWRSAAQATVDQISLEQAVAMYPQAGVMFGGGPVPGNS